MVGRSNGGGGPIVLNVAEKPSVARALAGAFNRMPRSRDGGMRRETHQIFTHENVFFPNIFHQGQGQRQNGQGAVPHTMITTSVRGHLASTDFSAEYGWGRIDPIQLFEAPIEIRYSDDMKQLQNMLSRLAKNVNAVILWLDCDREGEAIGDEVQTVCLEANPRLNTKIYRAKFSTVLDAEIRRALHSLGRLNDWFVQAVQARSEIDLRIGAAFTRFQTLRLQNKFQLSSGVISYGPCQFPTLGFVVERWARIEIFQPETFWFIELQLKLPNQGGGGEGDNPAAPSSSNHYNSNSSSTRPITFTWRRQRLYDRFLTLNLYESCLQDGTAVVTQMTGNQKSKWRPVPLATVELQKRASRYLRIGSEALMSAAEALYNEGYISYPRTETERFRPEFQHQPLLRDFAQGGGEFGAYAQRLLDGQFQNPRQGRNDDQAHPPITPCKVVDPNTIGDPAQRGVYRLVVKHYLACCSRDAIGNETTLSVRIGPEDFTAKGLMILEKNWLEIYEPWERWSTGQGELPPLQIGSRVVPHTLVMKEGTTTPPLPLTEAELISLMDKNKIGTDATIAQHITTILNREYAIKDANQRFLPTPLGIALVEGYNSMGYQLNKPELRREMEHECNLVANQQKTKDDIIGPILHKMKDCFQRAAAEAQKLDEAMAKRFQPIGQGNNLRVLKANFSVCGDCQNKMALKRPTGGDNTRANKVLYCNTCQKGHSLPRGKPEPKTEQENGGGAPFHCPICNFQVIKIVRGDGYEGNGYTFCPKCFNDPPAEHGGGTGGFRCFNCTHPTCSLASGTAGDDIEVFACPFCQQHNRNGKIRLKKTSKGYALGCSNYSSQFRCSYSIWMPRESKEIKIPEGDANLCQPCTASRGGPVRKIHFTWKPGSVPPHMGRECTACVLCDTALRQDMNMSLPNPNQVRTNASRSTGTNRNNSSAGRGGRGGNYGGTNSYSNNATSNNYSNSANTFGNSGNSRTNNRGNRGGMYNSRGGRGRGRGRGRGAGGAGRGNIVCFKCQQPGHYANACPNAN